MNQQTLFENMLQYFDELAEREPLLEPVISNFTGTTRAGVFVSILRGRPEIEPLLMCDETDREAETKKLITELLNKNNVDLDLLTPADMSKFTHFLLFWIEVILTDSDSEDEDE